MDSTFQIAEASAATKALATNFTLVIAGVLLYMLLLESRFRHSSKIQRYVIGFGFAILSVLSILDPVEIRPGVQIDAKYPMVMISALYGGPVAGAITAAFALSFRAFLGGIGIFAAIPATLVSLLLGLWLQKYRLLYTRSSWSFFLFASLLLCIGHLVSGSVYLLFGDSGQMFRIIIMRSIPAFVLYPMLTLFLGLSLDLIISRRQLQDQRDQLLLDIAQRNNELRSIHSTLLHDLRTPLVSIKGFLNESQMLLREGDCKGALHELDQVRKASDTLHSMLKGLSEYDRAGRSPDSVVEAAYSDTVIRNLLSERSPNNGGPVPRIEMQAGPWPVLAIPAMRLNQVLGILLDNALTFRSEERPLEIRFGFSIDNSDAVITVTDNGQGIPTAHQKRLFGLFEKVDARTGGMGLGLAIAQRIVHSHRGSIWLKSAGSEQGCSVSIRLPMHVTV